LSGSVLTRAVSKVFQVPLDLTTVLAKAVSRSFSAALSLTGQFSKVGGEEPPATDGEVVRPDDLLLRRVIRGPVSRIVRPVLDMVRRVVRKEPS
jgi:hypothetical protein